MRVILDANLSSYNKLVQIDYNDAKRNWTLQERGLDFGRAVEVFAGRHYTAEDVREGYGEQRFVTVGLLDGRMVVMVWTPRGEVRRIISMRKANEREQTRYSARFG